jgi:hypothetical protein
LQATRNIIAVIGKSITTKPNINGKNNGRRVMANLRVSSRSVAQARFRRNGDGLFS